MQDLDRAEELIDYADGLCQFAQHVLDNGEVDRAQRLLGAIEEAEEAAENAAGMPLGE